MLFSEKSFPVSFSPRAMGLCHPGDDMMHVAKCFPARAGKLPVFDSSGTLPSMALTGINTGINR